jgi:hypothetical protein
MKYTSQIAYKYKHAKLPYSWDAKAYKYKTVKSTPTSEITELNEYVFVVRIHINEHTSRDNNIMADVKHRQENFGTYNLYRYQF